MPGRERRRKNGLTGHPIPGFHAVCEALSGGTVRVLEVWIAGEGSSERAKMVRELAGAGKVPVRLGAGEELDRRLPGVAHQGFAALVGAPAYRDLDDFLKGLQGRAGRRLMIAADHITDEGNLGALIRTAAFFGAEALILPRDRSAQLSERVAKRSAGASLSLPVCRVVNLARALDRMDREGFWIIGAAGEAGTEVYAFDWDRDTLLVVGREDRGLTPNIRSRCHELVAVPGSGRVESLNVAVAAGAILSEINRQGRRREGENAPGRPRRPGP